ncbi:MAG: Crp/Fnr family transcriptional regulator [Mycobacteriales bacterium]
MAGVPSVSELLLDVPFVSAASAEHRARLAAMSYPKKLAKGQVLFVAGERCEAIYVVDSGRLKVSVTSPHGDELVLSVVGPGESVGELSIVDGEPRSAGAEAIEDTTLICLPRDAVLVLLSSSPGAALAIAVELAAMLRRLTTSAGDLVFLDLPRRLAKLLVSEPIDGLAQAQVAARLGVGRQSLNKALGKFADRGWLDVQRGAVTVRDAAALRRFADS